MSFHHSNVIPSFQAHSEVIKSFLCHSFIQNSSRYHSIIEISIQSFLCHSIILNSFLCHSYSFNDRNIVVWKSFIPSSFPAGMTLEWDTSHFGIIPRWNERRVRCVLIPLEWQGWPWNDWTGPGTTEWGGLPRGHSSFHPCHSSPIPSFCYHSKIWKQWWWPWNEGGVRPGSGPKLTTFPKRRRRLSWLRAPIGKLILLLMIGSQSCHHRNSTFSTGAATKKFDRKLIQIWKGGALSHRNSAGNLCELDTQLHSDITL